jgi:hypothetical protein
VVTPRQTPVACGFTSTPSVWQHRYDLSTLVWKYLQIVTAVGTYHGYASIVAQDGPRKRLDRQDDLRVDQTLQELIRGPRASTCTDSVQEMCNRLLTDVGNMIQFVGGIPLTVSGERDV